LVEIARDADVELVLTDHAAESQVAEWLADSGPKKPGHIVTDKTSLPSADTWRRPPVSGADIAFLQYTSGSTTAPKGVIVDHANIAANAGFFLEIIDAAPGARFGGWLPTYHDFGLIGQVLSPLLFGSVSVLMSPTAFLRHPHSWL